MCGASVRFGRTTLNDLRQFGIGRARELVQTILKSKGIWEEILDKAALETTLSSPMLTTLAISNYRSLRES